MQANFEWDPDKNLANRIKHGVSFATATHAFEDARKLVAADILHSRGTEDRYFCYGQVEGNVLTVRFVLRGNVI